MRSTNIGTIKPVKLTCLAGRRFGALLVISYSGHHSGKHNWLCSCSCGNRKELRHKSLMDGNASSCGCHQKNKARETQKKNCLTHGGSSSPEYVSWLKLKERCKDSGNRNYGGRGISVCDRWRDSFECFYRDMGKKPTTDHSIDRINNDGNYEPSNCRWATRSQQAMNQRIRKSNKSGVTGVYYNKGRLRWSASIRINGKQSKLITTPNFFEAVCARKSAELRDI